ncbi:hypothetical protein F2Q69_00039646 [Brassica cretica]|uniref:Uncharacterized protein n=1 Tax=Brassica cretica TaxID=69181 RepID=A0A8S9NP21_BRACR|nr:hypothetical protein F2Q69_00039646 [Brassica cretica]
MITRKIRRTKSTLIAAIVGDVSLGGSASATSMVVLLDGDGPLARWLSSMRKVSGVSVATELSLDGDEVFPLSHRFGVSVVMELSSTATELSLGGDEALSRQSP